MRQIHVCLHCRNLYLPANPAEPHRGATTVHCGQTQCASVVAAMVAALGRPEQWLQDRARKAAGIAGEPRVPRARGQRARRGAPGGRRTKLL
ncbi:hypothetical protein [Streptomyces acidiscabies]|uniref:hypothetical protein n=1 Tax=Streptomyces acidiscabies TaxID=42234 RepID=UPI000950F3EB|nr:hypothetical protein [Streptomyces acidiscabies]